MTVTDCERSNFSAALTLSCHQVDDNIGLIVSELKRTGLWGHINVMVTSDHGMAQCSPDRVIHLDACLHPDNYTLVDITPVAALIPREGSVCSVVGRKGNWNRELYSY